MSRLFKVILCLIPLLSTLAVSAQFLESIDRGTVALMKERGKAFVSWRSLDNDLENQQFDLYRQVVGEETLLQVNELPIEGTCFIDSSIRNGTGYRYHVVGHTEKPDPSDKGAYLFTMQYGIPYISIKLQTNAQPKSVGIADLDGDKKYDFVIKYPDFNVDPYSRSGYWKRSPEPYKLEAYSGDGTYLWTHNLGWSIETGTWYSPYLVYDIDRDGYAEVYTKAGEGDPREIDGHVLDGPEYLVKLDGRTGKVLKKTDWISKEGYESYNLWSRNFLSMAFLDGKDPSIIVQRGTYTIIKTMALDKDLRQEWYWESSGKYKHYSGQGQHGIISADIDNDDKDELIIGCAALDDNGIPMWTTGLGHNDVGHVADIDPDNPGLEIFYGLESSQKKHGVNLVDARTGKFLWAYEGSTVHVHAQGMAADIDPTHPGMECYAGEAKGGSKFFLYSAAGERLSDQSMGSLSPRPLWWDADEQKEMIINNSLVKYKGEELMKIEGKVLMVGDIMGDWREEIVTGLEGELRIYSTTIPSDESRLTLIQDRMYRLGVSRSTTGYYYPPQLSQFYKP
jgi:rhamnogalacturonan endolyase